MRGARLFVEFLCGKGSASSAFFVSFEAFGTDVVFFAATCSFEGGVIGDAARELRGVGGGVAAGLGPPQASHCMSVGEFTKVHAGHAHCSRRAA